MELNLRPGYYLKRDPDLLLLLRPDGSVAAVFSARGATVEAVEDAAYEDQGGPRLVEYASIENRNA